jgi:hypothetical protein
MEGFDPNDRVTVIARFLSQRTGQTPRGPVRRLLVESATGDRVAVVVPPSEYSRSYGLTTGCRYRFADVWWSRPPLLRGETVTARGTTATPAAARSPSATDEAVDRDGPTAGSGPTTAPRVAGDLGRAVVDLDVEGPFLLVTGGSRIDAVDDRADTDRA